MDWSTSFYNLHGNSFKRIWIELTYLCFNFICAPIHPCIGIHSFMAALRNFFQTRVKNNKTPLLSYSKSFQTQTQWSKILTVGSSSLVVDVDVLQEGDPHLPAGGVPPLLPDVRQLFPWVLVRGCQDVFNRGFEGHAFRFEVAVLVVKGADLGGAVGRGHVGDDVVELWRDKFSERESPGHRHLPVKLSFWAW